MNALSSLIHRIGGWYISATVLLMTHTLAVLIGMALMFAAVVTVCAQTIPGFTQQISWVRG